MTNPAGRLYVRQLLAGRDFAVSHPLAAQMANYIYLLGDRETRECVVVDAAYDPVGIMAIAETDGMSIVGAVVTHYHADHAGGRLGTMGQIDGLVELLGARDVPVHAQRAEVAWLAERTGIAATGFVAHDSGDVVAIGGLALTVIHTPGHTEGSQCLLVEGRLVTGDTLFLDGCGRTDLPGGDPVALYESLHQRLAPIPDDAVVLPGHAYAKEPEATLADVRLRNAVLWPATEREWLSRYAPYA